MTSYNQAVSGLCNLQEKQAGLMATPSISHLERAIKTGPSIGYAKNFVKNITNGSYSSFGNAMKGIGTSPYKPDNGRSFADLSKNQHRHIGNAVQKNANFRQQPTNIYNKMTAYNGLNGTQHILGRMQEKQAGGAAILEGMAGAAGKSKLLAKIMEGASKLKGGASKLKGGVVDLYDKHPLLTSLGASTALVAPPALWQVGGNVRALNEEMGKAKAVAVEKAKAKAAETPIDKARDTVMGWLGGAKDTAVNTYDKAKELLQNPDGSVNWLNAGIGAGVGAAGLGALGYGANRLMNDDEDEEKNANFNALLSVSVAEALEKRASEESLQSVKDYMGYDDGMVDGLKARVWDKLAIRPSVLDKPSNMLAALTLNLPKTINDTVPSNLYDLVNKKNLAIGGGLLAALGLGGAGAGYLAGRNWNKKEEKKAGWYDDAASWIGDKYDAASRGVSNMIDNSTEKRKAIGSAFEIGDMRRNQMRTLSDLLTETPAGPTAAVAGLGVAGLGAGTGYILSKIKNHGDNRRAANQEQQV